MQLLDLFTTKCLHRNVPIDTEYSYCPDCGALIENQWYLVRCACCGVKIIATCKNGQIVPLKNYCHNCGSKNYTIERLEKIDCVNVNYAVLLQVEVNPEIKEYIQSWVNAEHTVTNPKLQNSNNSHPLLSPN